MSAPSGEEWLGQDYQEAVASARPFRILVTRPPYACLGKGPLVIIGQRQQPEGLCLIASYTQFERRSRPGG